MNISSREYWALALAATVSAPGQDPSRVCCETACTAQTAVRRSGQHKKPSVSTLGKLKEKGRVAARAYKSPVPHSGTESPRSAVVVFRGLEGLQPTGAAHGFSRGSAEGVPLHLKWCKIEPTCATLLMPRGKLKPRIGSDPPEQEVVSWLQPLQRLHRSPPIFEPSY